MQDSDFRTARQLLELLRAKLGGVSDYRLAKILGMSHQGISTVMTNDATFGPCPKITTKTAYWLPFVGSCHR